MSPLFGTFTSLSGDLTARRSSSSRFLLHVFVDVQYLLPFLRLGKFFFPRALPANNSFAYPSTFFRPSRLLSLPGYSALMSVNIPSLHVVHLPFVAAELWTPPSPPNLFMKFSVLAELFSPLKGLRCRIFPLPT